MVDKFILLTYEQGFNWFTLKEAFSIVRRITNEILRVVGLIDAEKKINFLTNFCMFVNLCLLAMF